MARGTCFCSTPSSRTRQSSSWRLLLFFQERRSNPCSIPFFQRGLFFTMPPSEGVTREVLQQHTLIARSIRRRPAVRRVFKSLRQANVVLHCDLNPGPRSTYLASMFGAELPTGVPGDADMQLISCPAKPQSAFAHWKIKTTAGTILVFNSWHVIRSGGSSHACALTSLFRFVNFLRLRHSKSHGLVWPSSASIPNSVYAGQFAQKIGDSFKSSVAATYTSKFPGIAVTLPIPEKVTPEVFLKASKFILPGVKTASVLVEALSSLATIASPHCTDGLPSA